MSTESNISMSIEQLEQISNSIKSKLNDENTLYYTVLSEQYNDALNYINNFNSTKCDNIDICVLLQMCCYLNLTNEFKTLLENNKKKSIEKFNKITSIFYACYNQNKELVEMLFDMEWNNDILIFALNCCLFACIENNNADILLFLIEQKKVNVNINVTDAYLKNICKKENNMLKDINIFFENKKMRDLLNDSKTIDAN